MIPREADIDKMLFLYGQKWLFWKLWFLYFRSDISSFESIVGDTWKISEICTYGTRKYSTTQLLDQYIYAININMCFGHQTFYILEYILEYTLMITWI